MRLILMRHAHAVDPQDEEDDKSRVLSSKGKRQAAQVGAKLSELNWSPDLALISDSIRTKQTWEHMSEAFPAPVPHHFRSEIYLSTYDGLIKVLDRELQTLAQKPITLMVLGHNPTLEDLANFLLPDGPKISLSKSAALCLQSKEGASAPLFSRNPGWGLAHHLRAST